MAVTSLLPGERSTIRSDHLYFRPRPAKKVSPERGVCPDIMDAPVGPRGRGVPPQGLYGATPAATAPSREPTGAGVCRDSPGAGLARFARV